MSGFSSSSPRFPVDDELIIATTNRNKFREICAALVGEAELPVRLKSLHDVFPAAPAEAPSPPEETGGTFAENAGLKAAHYWRALRRPVLAEDSGLVIPSLGGFPGLHSARVAGDDPARIALVLEKLAAQPGRLSRSAYYICSMVIIAGRVTRMAEGRCDGRIAEAPRGTGGFGYDPIFLPDGAAGLTFGEMTLEQKTQYSHRGKAGQRMSALILQLLAMGNEQ